MTHDFLDLDTLVERAGMTRSRVENLLESARKKGRRIAKQQIRGCPVEYSWQDFKAAMPTDRRHSDATSRAMGLVRR